MGDVSITNDTTPQITAIITTNASAVPATNYVTATWATTNGSAPILLSTNTIVRTRLWDGFFWSIAATSQPFMVDNEAPTMPSSFSVTSHIVSTWSTQDVIYTRWIGSSDGSGGGLIGYQIALTNANPSSFNVYTTCTETQAVLTSWSNGTNWWLAVRAVDIYGNASPTPSFLGPFMIDADPPSSSNAVMIIVGSAFGNYTLGTVVTSSWAGFFDDASGISGYYYDVVDGKGTTNGTWTTATNAELSGLQINQTSTIYVWARDNLGLIGSSTNASILLLDSGGDFDGDGLSNAQEEITGTAADDIASVFSCFSPDISVTGSVTIFVFNWPSALSRLYNLYTTDSLYETNWSHSVTNIIGTGDIMAHTNIVDTNKPGYFKLTVTMP